MFQWIGMVEYIPCYSGPAEHWGFLPATRLASRIILIEQNIKKRTGPALCVLCATTLTNTQAAALLGGCSWSFSCFLSCYLFLSKITFKPTQYFVQLGGMCWLRTAFLLQSSWLALSKTICHAVEKTFEPCYSP